MTPLRNRPLTRYILFILGALLIIPGLTSCEKDTDDRLRGRWQFRYCEYPNGGTYAYDSAFYNFDSRVFKLQRILPGQKVAHHFANYVATDDSLHITDLKQYSYYQIGIDTPPYEWIAEKRKSYAIEKLTRKELILTSHDTVYHFRLFQ